MFVQGLLTTRLRRVLYALVATVTVLTVVGTLVVDAAPSAYLNFQARLLTATGAPVADGTYNIRFSLYDVSSGGTALWSEEWLNSGSDGVVVKDGYLSVSLGTQTSFPGTINWQDELWLGMTVRGTGSCAFAGCSPADGEMTPRMQVTAVPFAFRARELAVTSGGFTNILTFATPAGSSKTISVPNASGTVAVSASGNIALDSAGNISLTGQIPVANGGTNASTAQGAINNLAGLTTEGDLLYNDGTNATRLARGSNGECLTSSSTTIVWGSCGAGSVDLQVAYDNGNTVVTTNARDVDFTLANTATDSNFLVDIATGSTGKFAVQGNGSDLFSVNTSAIALAVPVTVSGSNTLTVGTGLTTLGGGLTISAGAVTISDLVTDGIVTNTASGVLGTVASVPVDRGGTGATTLTPNGVLYGNGTSSIQATIAGTGGQLLLANGSGVPTFTSMSSDATISATGVLTIATNAVALGTDTTGNYVAGISSGSGISVSGGTGENITNTLSLGNLTADWVQSAAFNIVMDNASSDLRIKGAGGSNYGIFDVASLTTGNSTYTFPDLAGGSGTVCLSTNNCNAQLAGNFFQQNGNSFTGTATLGTNDVFDLNLEANDTVRVTVSATTGNVGIGDTSPAALLTVGTSDAFQVNSSGNIQTSGSLTVGGATTLSGDLSVTGTTTIASTADDGTFTGFVTNDSGVLKYRTKAQVAQDIAAVTKYTANSNSSLTAGTWYRIATSSGANGRFGARITVSNTGSSGNPSQLVFNVVKDWALGATITLVSNSATECFTEVRVVADDSVTTTEGYVDIRSAGCAQNKVTVVPEEGEFANVVANAFTTPAGGSEVTLTSLTVSGDTFTGVASTEAASDFYRLTSGSLYTKTGYIQSGTTANTLSGATSITASGTALNLTAGGLSVTGASGFGSTLSVTGDVTLSSDLAVNGGDITTSAATASLYNSGASTVNIAGAATTVNIAASSGSTTINNALLANRGLSAGSITGGAGITLLPGSADHAYIQIFADTDNPSTRSAYLGYGSAGSSTFILNNEIGDSIYLGSGSDDITISDSLYVSGATTLQGVVTLGALGTADTSAMICRNSSNQLASCVTTGSGAPFVQNGNSFGATAVLGTNDNQDLSFETNGSNRLTIGTSGSVSQAGGVYQTALSGGQYVYQNVTSGQSIASGVTGAIVVTTNLDAADSGIWLNDVQMSLYEYNTENRADFSLSFYKYGLSSYFYNYSYSRGGSLNPQIRLGHNASGKVVIIIGGTGDTREYPQFTLRSLSSNHGTLADFEGWTTAVNVTSLAGYTDLTTVSEKNVVVAQSITNSGGYIQSGSTANTFTGSTAFTGTGTGLSVTNSATIGGNLTVNTQSGSADTIIIGSPSVYGSDGNDGCITIYGEQSGVVNNGAVCSTGSNLQIIASGQEIQLLPANVVQILNGKTLRLLNAASSSYADIYSSANSLHIAGGGSLDSVNIDSSTLYVDTANNTVGIGAAPSSLTKLYVYNANKTGSGNYGINTFLSHTTSSSATEYNIGTSSGAYETVSSGQTNSGYIMGTDTQAWLDNGVQTGTITGVYGSRIQAGNGTASAGTITGAYGLSVDILNAGSGTITTGIGVVVSDIQATNGYAFYQSGANDANYFAGDIHAVGGAGTSNATASVLGASKWRFRQSPGDEANAGVIDYRNFDATALSIVGAGAGGPRLVRIYDNLGVGTAPSTSYTVNVGGTLNVSGASTLGSTLAVTGAASFDGNLTFGNATSDTITFNGRVNSNILPSVDATYDLGSPTNRWNNIYLNNGVSTGGYLNPTNDNLLYNGDFEFGNATGWTGFTTVTSGGYAGNYTGSVTNSNQIESADYIPVDPTRDVLQLEAWVKETVTGSTPGTLYAGYIAYDASKTAITTAPCGTYCYFAAAAANVPNDGNWHKYSSTSTGEGTGYPNFPVNTKYVRVLFLANYASVGGETILIDHVSLKRVNNGPLFVGNNYSTTNLVDQNQVSKIFTDSNNYLNIQAPSSNQTLYVGDFGYGTGYVGIGASTAAASYSLLSDSVNTFINSATAGSVYIRDNNAGVAAFDAGGSFVYTALTVSNATSLSSTLAVTGTTTLGSTLAVTGAGTFSSTLGVSGAATLSSTLDVAGRATFAGGTGSAYSTAGLELYESNVSGTSPRVSFHLGGSAASQIGYINGDTSGDISVIDAVGTGYESLRVSELKIGTTVVVDTSANLTNIGTITTSGAINGQTITNAANFTGSVTAANYVQSGGKFVSSNAQPGLILAESDTTNVDSWIDTENGILRFLTVNDAQNSWQTNMTIDNATGNTAISRGTLALAALGTTDTATLLCRNSSNVIAACNTTGAGAVFVQGGNSFGATATLGTNDAQSLQFETNNTARILINSAGLIDFQSNALTNGFIGTDNIYSSMAIGNLNNTLVRADEKYTVTTSAGFSGTASMFDGADGPAGTILASDVNASNRTVTVNFGSVQHYWHGVRVHFTWQAYGNADSFLIEYNYNTANDGNCSNPSNAWTTLADVTGFTGNDYFNNAGFSWACGIRLTLRHSNATSGIVYIGEFAAYQKYYGDNGLYTKRTGDTIYGNLNVGTSATPRSLGVNDTTNTYALEVNGVIEGQSIAGVGDVLRAGNDSKLVDINVLNTLGVYGLTDTTIGSIQLGSGGGTVSGYNANIGIGTTAPATTLDVRASSSPAITVGTASNTDGALYFGNTGHGVKRNYSGSNDVGLYTTSANLYLAANGAVTNQFILTNAGNVGIGDASPAALLTVGNGDLFQVNSSGAIAAVTGITTSGGYTQSGTSVNTLTGRTVLSGASTGDAYSQAPLEILQTYGASLDAPHISFHYGGQVASQIGFMKGDGSGDISVLNNPGTGYETLRVSDLKIGTTTVIDGSANLTNILNASIGGTLTVTGATTLNSTLAVTGLATFSNNIALPATTSTTTGVITKGGSSFLHNFQSNGTFGSTVGYNTFLGLGAGNFTLGSAAGAHEASYNTAVGTFSSDALTTGFYNSALGYNTLAATTTGYSNVAVGLNSLAANTIGYENTALGLGSLQQNVDGDVNSAVGLYALYGNTSGNNNTGSGTYSLYSNQTGSSNVSLGYASGFGAATLSNVSSNVFVGSSAGYGIRTGGDANTFLGVNTGYSNSTGAGNVLLGAYTGDALTTGSRNIAIGYNVDVQSATGNDQLNIGNLIYGTGVDGQNSTLSSGNIGIGVASPNTKLDVAGAISRSENSVRTYKLPYSYSEGNSPSTGTYKLVLPKSWSDTMLRITIRGYDYSANGAWEAVVSGYNYAGGSYWANVTAEISGSAPFSSVRVGHDGSRNVILLGATTTDWYYPKITVEEVIAGHAGYDGWGTGWSSSFITSETGITGIVTPTVRQTAYSTNAFLQGGNSFGASAVLGTNDGQSLLIRTSGATRITVDASGNQTNTGYISITGAADSSGNLRFSAANPYIYASSYIVMPGGAYFSSGTVYAEAALQARGGIGDDGGDLDLLDNVNVTGTLTLTGGATGATPTPELLFANVYDSAGAPSTNKIQLYTGYGLGVSSADLDLLSGGNIKFHSGGTEDLLVLDGSGNADVLGGFASGTANAFNVNTSGTVTSGTWQGAAVATSYGGTGATTTQAAINNLSQLTTEGDLLFRDATNSTRLARGTNGQCLTSNATTVVWASCSAGDVQLSPGSVQATSSANTAIRINQTGAGGLLQLQANGEDKLTLSNTGVLSLGAVTNTGGTAALFASDNFNRANQSPFGNTSSGHTYSYSVGSGSFTLTSNAGNGGTVGNEGVALIDVNATDGVELKGDITTGGSGTTTDIGFALLASSRQDSIIGGIYKPAAGAAQYHLYKTTPNGGNVTYTNLAIDNTADLAYSTTYTVRMSVKNNVVSLYVNDILRLSHTLTAAEQTEYGSNDSHGIRVHQNNIGSIDNVEWRNLNSISGGSDTSYSSFTASDGGATFRSDSTAALEVRNITGVSRLRVDAVNGNVTISGNTTTYTQRLCHSGANGATTNMTLGDCAAAGQADLAEMYDTNGNLEPGDVVAPIGGYKVDRTTSAYQSSAIGVVSTNPVADGILGHNVTSPNRQPIALAGRIPVKVSLENGPIVAGDKLTPATTPGFAMKATASGLVIGTALEDYDGSQPRVSSLVAAEEHDRTTAHAGVLTPYASNPSLWPTNTGKIMMIAEISSYTPPISDLLFGSGLTINGDSSLLGSVTIANDLMINGETTITKLVVKGTARFEQNLVVIGDLDAGSISVNGHITSTGNVPEVKLSDRLLTGEESVLAGNPELSIDGTDVAGNIRIKTKARVIDGGQIALIKFNQSFTTPPKVILTAADDNASVKNLIINQKDVTIDGFAIKLVGDVLDADQQYELNYFVIETGPQVAGR